MPYSISAPDGSNTCTNRLSEALRSISSAANCGFCTGTTIDARSRGSRASHSAAIQSFTAEHIAAAGHSLGSVVALKLALNGKFNAVVVEDATADRVKTSHKTALLDIWMKYADVDTTDAVAEYLKGLPR